MGKLLVTGFPVLEDGRTLLTATLAVVYFAPYYDGTRTYSSIWLAVWDMTNGSWKPPTISSGAPAPDGTPFYLPGAESGERIPPPCELIQRLNYVDGVESPARIVRTILATSPGEWVYGSEGGGATGTTTATEPGAFTLQVFTTGLNASGIGGAFDADENRAGGSFYKILLNQDVFPSGDLLIFRSDGFCLPQGTAWMRNGRSITFNPGWRLLAGETAYAYYTPVSATALSGLYRSYTFTQGDGGAWNPANPDTRSGSTHNIVTVPDLLGVATPILVFGDEKYLPVGTAYTRVGSVFTLLDGHQLLPGETLTIAAVPS